MRVYLTLTVVFVFYSEIIAQQAGWSSFEQLYSDNYITVEISFKIIKDGCDQPESVTASRYKYRVTGQPRNYDYYLTWKMDYVDCNGNLYYRNNSLNIGSSSSIITTLVTDLVVYPDDEEFTCKLLQNAHYDEKGAFNKSTGGGLMSENSDVVNTVRNKSASNYYSKDEVLEIGILNRRIPGLSLDYVAHIAESSMFFFTYSHTSKTELFTTIHMEDYKLVDLESGKSYYATHTDLPKSINPRVIYNGNKSRFTVWFDRLPSTVKKINLVEGSCNANSFCFQNINLSDYSEANDFNYTLYEDTEEEGTLAFYTNYGKSGDTKIYIEGYLIGILTEYFTDEKYTPECGQQGTLTLRLNAGTYNFKASDDNYKWSGKIEITKNECQIQGLTK